MEFIIENWNWLVQHGGRAIALSSIAAAAGYYFAFLLNKSQIQSLKREIEFEKSKISHYAKLASTQETQEIDVSHDDLLEVVDSSKLSIESVKPSPQGFVYQQGQEVYIAVVASYAVPPVLKDLEFTLGCIPEKRGKGDICHEIARKTVQIMAGRIEISGSIPKETLLDYSSDTFTIEVSMGYLDNIHGHVHTFRRVETETYCIIKEQKRLLRWRRKGR